MIVTLWSFMIYWKHIKYFFVGVCVFLVNSCFLYNIAINIIPQVMRHYIVNSLFLSFSLFFTYQIGRIIVLHWDKA